MNKLEALILALNDLNIKNKEDQEQYKFQKQSIEQKLQKEFKKSKVKDDSYSFNHNDEILKATFVQPKKVIFDVDKLEKKLDKEIADEVIIKQYKILDYQGMVEYLKSLGAKPKEFKKFIYCEKEVKNKRIDELGELGIISEDDIEDCCTVNPLSSYFKITSKEIESEDE